jgi:hypothetical protein
MSKASVFLDIEKSFDVTWHPVLLYKLSKLEFSSSLIKLINSFSSQSKLKPQDAWRQDEAIRGKPPVVK